MVEYELFAPQWTEKEKPKKANNKKKKHLELLNGWSATLVQRGTKGKIPPLKFPFTHTLTNVINTLCKR